MLIYNSPQLIAVNRVLLRLLMPRHSPYALVRLNIPKLFSSELYEFHLNMVIYSSWKGIKLPSFECFHLAISRFGEIVVITLDIGKTLNSIDLVNLMSSISVRFNSFLFSYSIFNERKDLILSDLIFFCHRGLKFQLIAVLPRLLAPGTAGWSVRMDPNRRPHTNA